MFFFHRQNILDQASGCGTFVGQISNHLAVTIDRHPLCDEILFNHLDEAAPLDIFRMTPTQQTIGRQIRFTAQLDNPLRDLIGMELFFVGMLQKLLGNTWGIDSICHEIMSLIAQDTNDFCRERFVEDPDNCFTISRISSYDGLLVDMFSRTLTQLPHIREE